MNTLDTPLKDLNQGTKRDISQVSPGSVCSPESKVTLFSESPITKSNMADTENTAEDIAEDFACTTPSWFMNFDKHFDTRVGKLIDEKLSEKLDMKFDDISRTVSEATKLTAEAMRHVKVMESKLVVVTKENIQLKSKLNEIELKLDNLENYGRRQNLVFEGVPDSLTITDAQLIYDIIGKKMGIEDANKIQFDACHRIGKKIPSRSRPIIVRFTCRADRDRIWRSRSKLKGSDIYVKEDLSLLADKARRQ